MATNPLRFAAGVDMVPSDRTSRRSTVWKGEPDPVPIDALDAATRIAHGRVRLHRQWSARRGPYRVVYELDDQARRV